MRRTASYPAHPPSPPHPHLSVLEASQGLRCQVSTRATRICKRIAERTILHHFAFLHVPCMQGRHVEATSGCALRIRVVPGIC